jgi:hypothetical protein
MTEWAFWESKCVISPVTWTAHLGYIVVRRNQLVGNLLMKSYDSFPDRQSRDNGFDMQASRSLSRDVDTPFRIGRINSNERQSLSVATNYFALACPIMPIGLLGAFLFLEKMGALYDGPKELEAEQTTRERGELSQALYIAAMKQKIEAERKKNLDAADDLLCSRPVEGLMPMGVGKHKRKTKEAALLLSGKSSERVNGPVMLSKPQQDIGKIVKQKLQLQSHLEKLCQEQDFGAVCRVSSKLDLLTKALKKLGC